MALNTTTEEKKMIRRIRMKRIESNSERSVNDIAELFVSIIMNQNTREIKICIYVTGLQRNRTVFHFFFVLARQMQKNSIV